MGLDESMGPIRDLRAETVDEGVEIEDPQILARTITDRDGSGFHLPITHDE